MGYTQVQEDWCRKNEEEIWKYLVGNKILFSTNQSDIGLMMNDGPFTNGFPKESPARTGVWMGWQIARAWVNRNVDVNDFSFVLREVFGVADHTVIETRTNCQQHIAMLLRAIS